ncbi:hypothetical protein HDU96_005095, partial [Phlyctochytrium bullatum]
MAQVPHGINSVESVWVTYFEGPVRELQHSKSRILFRQNENGIFEDYRHWVGKLDGLWQHRELGYRLERIQNGEANKACTEAKIFLGSEFERQIT